MRTRSLRQKFQACQIQWKFSKKNPAKGKSRQFYSQKKIICNLQKFVKYFKNDPFRQVKSCAKGHAPASLRRCEWVFCDHKHSASKPSIHHDPSKGLVHLMWCGAKEALATKAYARASMVLCDMGKRGACHQGKVGLTKV
jgi:hypothetical protein